MKEIKAFIRSRKVQEIVPELKKSGYLNVSFSLCEGTGSFKDNDASPSLLFHVTDSQIAKLELVCANDNVDEIIGIITKYGRTHEDGDGIVYVTPIEKAIKVKNGEDASLNFIKNKNTD